MSLNRASRTMEVLAPAGSPESLTAAVRAGADAVYLGGANFSARAGAENFNNDQLREAVFYCHARGVKVHLAVNTLLFDGELESVLDFVRYACTLPVDAVLIQDMGLFRLIRERAPGLVLHASTQTGVHTPSGVKALEQEGFSRVVLARELSLEEITEIHASCPIELEAFVHGALCMSVSGQCYFSSVLGSRSGNRGLCAQPCRLPFMAPGGTGHDLSLKDLSMIPRMGELERAGVISAKIEGRLKRPEYVAAAVTASCFAADGEPIPPKLLSELEAVFSRSGFTTGYPDHRLGREMFGIRSKEDVTGATRKVFSDLHSLYRHENRKIPVDFILKIKYNKPIQIIAADREGFQSSVEGPVPEKAERVALGKERCEEQMKKTGGTPFFANRVDCDVDDGFTVPLSELNRLRRNVLKELERQREVRPPVRFRDMPQSVPPAHTAAEIRLRARFVHTELPEAAKNCELVYVPCTADPHRLSRLLEDGFPVAVEIPRGLFGMENEIRRRLENAKAAGVTHVWAGNLDGAALGKDLGFSVHGGFSLNITNTSALEWVREFGLADCELSFEMTLAQVARVGGDFPRGLLLYGRLPMMLCRNCPAANSEKGCLHCKTAPELTDRRGVKFPVQCYGACSEVLNSVPLYLADRMAEVKNQDFGLLRFSTESIREEEDVLNTYFKALRGVPSLWERGSYTRGLYYRGVE